MEEMNTNLRDLYWKKLLGEPLTEVDKQALAEWEAAYPEQNELFVLDEALQSHGRFKREKKVLLQSFDQWFKPPCANQPALPVATKRPRTKRIVGYGMRAAAVVLLVWGGYQWLFTDRAPVPAPSAGTVEIRQSALSDTDLSVVLVLADSTRFAVGAPKAGVLPNKDIPIRQLSSGELVYEGAGRDQTSHQGYHEVWVPKGQSQWVQLPDGSRVCLNGGSGIRFPLSSRDPERRVGLLGEAYFEVAPLPDKPFVVIADGVIARALGTRFSFRAYPDEGAQTLSLAEGLVLVNYGEKKDSVHTGQVVKISAQQGLALQSVPLAEMLAYKDGAFYFESSPIGPILQELARWYKVRIVKNQFLYDQRRQHIPWTSRQTDLRTILANLEHSSPLRFQFDGTSIKVLR